jgi:photosystem II stability/assembly factor-like uncharacterized protein
MILAMRAAYLITVVLLTASCSSRSTPGKDSGPIWPDLILDFPAVDHARPDRARDLAPDAPARDVIGVDALREAAPAGGWTTSTIAFVDLHDVSCVQGHVFVVGYGGTILHRAPGAAFFASQTSPATDDLYTVSFASAGTYGVAAGKGPSIWQTQDLGTTWTLAPQCSAYIFDTFFALHVDSATSGYGAGVTLAAMDAGSAIAGGAKYFGGASWVCTTPTHPGELFYDVFRAGKNGWIVGDTGGKIYHTVDEGLTWSATSAGTTQALRGVQLTSGAVGVAVGNGGAIVRSSDGFGLTWAPVSSGVTANLYDVAFWDALTGWIVGDKGTVLRTDDGGVSWKLQPTPTTARLEGVCFTSATDGWAVGAGGMLLTTTSGGK